MKGIKIAYDAKRAVENMTGLGNYSRLVVATMAALYPDNEYALLAPRRRENPRLDPILMRENVELLTPSTALGRRLPALWRSAGMVGQLASIGADLYHGLSNELPLTAGMAPCATVVTIHDLIWRIVPADYHAIDRRLYELKYSRSARLATRVIAISERTKADMVEMWHIDPDKIDVIYQGCDPAFGRHITTDDRMRVRKAYGLDFRYIITVGTVQTRKNQLLAVKALEGLPEDVRLVIVGRDSRGYADAICSYAAAHRLTDRVVWLEGVPFDELPVLYSAAEFSSYTSRYEGFGIPVIESLTAGTPVIACSGSCLEEAGGPGAIYVGPDDVQAYTQAARDLLEKAYLRDRLADEGKRYVRRFNPRTFAESIMKTYTRALLDFSIDK